MPNEQDTKVDELEIATTEAESAEDTQNTSEGEGESETVVELKDEGDSKVEKLSPAEENAKRQEEAWLMKVTSGKNSVEDAPKWLQSRLNARLEVSSKVPETEEVVRKALAKEREDQEFEREKSNIPKLSPAKAKELQERFKALRPAGKVVALRAALDAMGLSKSTRDSEVMEAVKAQVSLPRSGQPKVSKSDRVVGGLPLGVVQSDKAWNELVRGN